MVTLNAHFDGKTLVFDEPLSLAPNQKLRVTIETIEDPTAKKPDRVAGRSGDAGKRQFGQQKDAVRYIAPDFADHLGDDFWGLPVEQPK